MGATPQLAEWHFRVSLEIQVPSTKARVHVVGRAWMICWKIWIAARTIQHSITVFMWSKISIEAWLDALARNTTYRLSSSMSTTEQPRNTTSTKGKIARLEAPVKEEEPYKDIYGTALA